jgi:hypothetical protein
MMQKNNLNNLSLWKKRSEKSEILKKIFLGKKQKRMVFSLETVKLGVDVYFSGAI